ncbi:hypothetical protein [Methylorubrum extorquens]|uniref:Uncharacterized protein n=1 Tax=Methylorubrum extorquens TaxID=408 RepID=A0AAX3WF82_METEX|nr:hypothetical protein [Methylorubrum extorquens]WHQ69527.1 hypothetical protein KEC54_24840 [Methylorubrum extorquens]
MLPTKNMRPAPTISVPDRGAIFSDILRRQALRRESQLPLLNVRAEYERAVEEARWRAHVEKNGEAIRAQVLAELRAKNGPQFGGSACCKWAVKVLASRRLHAMLDKSA